MLSHHCVAHRLALAVAKVSSSIPYIKKLNDILDTLYRFDKNSPVRLSALRKKYRLVVTTSNRLLIKHNSEYSV